MEEISAGDWVEKVYRPDIRNRPANFYKKPGYDEAICEAPVMKIAAPVVALAFSADAIAEGQQKDTRRTIRWRK
jgi:hypothetical protein